MRSIMSLVVVGMMASLSTAFAASDNVPSAIPTQGPGSELKCRFEGRGFDQHDELRCYVRAKLCGGLMAPGTVANDSCDRNREQEFELRCTNGFELESRDIAVSTDRDNLWINADERGHTATIRVKLHSSPETRYENRARAELLIANRVVHRLEGSCSFDYEHAPELN